MTAESQQILTLSNEIDQPRVAAGVPEGGQWTDSGWGGSGLGSQTTRDAAQGARSPTTQERQRPVRHPELDRVRDADGKPYYQRGGHHEMPKGVYEKWELREDTRRVFERGTTGTVPRMTIRSKPDGVPVGHFWKGPGGLHRAYNDAVEDLSNKYFARNNITPEQMTPKQALELMKEIRETNDPRIHVYNRTMRLFSVFSGCASGEASNDLDRRYRPRSRSRVAGAA